MNSGRLAHNCGIYNFSETLLDFYLRFRGFHFGSRGFFRICLSCRWFGVYFFPSGRRSWPNIFWLSSSDTERSVCNIKLINSLWRYLRVSRRYDRGFKIGLFWRNRINSLWVFNLQYWTIGGSYFGGWNCRIKTFHDFRSYLIIHMKDLILLFDFFMILLVESTDFNAIVLNVSFCFFFRCSYLSEIFYWVCI